MEPADQECFKNIFPYQKHDMEVNVLLSGAL